MAIEQSANKNKTFGFSTNNNYQDTGFNDYNIYPISSALPAHKNQEIV